MKGGFKLFGAEVSGTAGGFARVVAFGLGIIMILVGIGFHEAASPAPSPTSSPPAPAPVYVPPQPVAVAPPPVIPAPQPAPVAQARISVRAMFSSAETNAFVSSLPDAMKLQLYANFVSTGMDIHAARVVVSNTGTMPVNVFPQNITVISGAQPLQTLAPAHPTALKPGLLYPCNQTQGIVVFAAPTVIMSAAMSVIYNDPTIQVGYER